MSVRLFFLKAREGMQINRVIVGNLGVALTMSAYKLFLVSRPGMFSAFLSNQMERSFSFRYQQQGEPSLATLNESESPFKKPMYFSFIALISIAILENFINAYTTY